MKTCAVYHCWSHEGEPHPHQNLRTPTLLSIATLRAVSDLPIVVLDISDKPKNWFGFPQKLNFKVNHIPAQLASYGNLIKGNLHLSRIFDAHEWALNEQIDEIIYVDSDVFFFKDILPLACDSSKFCWNSFNSGFFYYQPNTNSNRLFFDIFKSYSLASIYSDDMRNITSKYVNYFNWYGVCDEMILGYMQHKHFELFNKIPLEEHSTSSVLHAVNRNTVKMFHANGSMIKDRFTGSEHARGLFCLLFKELYDNIIKVLNPNDLKSIFGVKNLTDMNSRRMKIFDSLDKLPTIYKNSGHYWFDELSKIIRMF